MVHPLATFYPLLFNAFQGDPEAGHAQLLQFLHRLDRQPDALWVRWLRSQMEQNFCYCSDRLASQHWGLAFSNPLGLAPGCDKDGQAAGVWSAFGFGFAELGAITQHPQPGNPRPRLFRLPEDRAALNRLGANNLGATTMAQTLGNSWQRRSPQIPIGINLCKSKITPLEEAPQDYLASLRSLYEVADYFVINVSSPNTPGLRDLQGGEQLAPILAALQDYNQGRKPLLIKIAPDLAWEAIAEVIALAQQHQLSGIVATNTTIRRDGLKTQTLAATGNPITEEAGGISGQPLTERSTEIIRQIYRHTQGQLPIIGIGGIFTAEDAWAKISAGASLLQFYTGWIYEGPWVVPQILQGLDEKLKNLGLNHLREAVGWEHRSP